MSEWVRVAHADEVQAGTPFATTLDDDALVLARLGDDIVALEDLCTHDGSDISGGCIVDGAIECPRHGARFCLRTGEVLSPPAYEGLHVFPVRIEDGRRVGERRPLGLNFPMSRQGIRKAFDGGNALSTITTDLKSPAR